MEADTEAPPKRTMAPPPARKKTPAPRPHEWPMRLRELFREWKLMLEDFGLTKTTLARYAEQAKRGDKGAQEKLEPLRQVMFELMGLTQEERLVRHMEGELAGKVVMDESGEFTTVNDRRVPIMAPQKETRSVFGMRDGPDMLTHTNARKPKPGLIKNKVDDHFYDLCQLLEFVKRAMPLKLHGQRHPNPEGFAEAHKYLTSGGTVPGKAFADGNRKKLEESYDAVIDKTEDPARRDSLTLIKPFLLEGKKSEWDGLA